MNKLRKIGGFAYNCKDTFHIYTNGEKKRNMEEAKRMAKRSSARTQERIGQDSYFQSAWNRAQHWERERKKYGLESSVPHGDHVGAYHHANLNNRLTAHMKGF